MAANRFLALTVAAAIGLATAAPVQAKWTPIRAEHIRSEIDALEAHVNRADNRDRISEREARDLRRRIADLRGQFHRFNANGLNQAETRKLQARIDKLRARLRMEKHDWNRHAG